MPLTPPKKNVYWISIIFMIIGLICFIIALVETFTTIFLLGLFGLAWLWIIFVFIFLFIAWFLLYAGVSWKGF